MSTAFRAPSQVRPNAFYRVSTGTQLFNESGVLAGPTIVANTILQDKGKTVYMGDNILRKVKVLDSADPAKTGYIYLTKVGGVTQDIAAL